jgi:hypothetical protein
MAALPNPTPTTSPLDMFELDVLVERGGELAVVVVELVVDVVGFEDALEEMVEELELEPQIPPEQDPDEVSEHLFPQAPQL